MAIVVAAEPKLTTPDTHLVPTENAAANAEAREEPREETALNLFKAKPNQSQRRMRLTKDAEALVVLRLGFFVIKHVHQPRKLRVLLFCRVWVTQKPQRENRVQQTSLEESVEGIRSGAV
ncbi:hypothetical protein DV515_00001976 [Chloebia gouldiae]|uniref:Uncharacterized protein n=1 Tax=Chloebia gouldiae TaxID=44316 RepID=A0A3L8SX01_CHLGU|nr:hypothetical protein DV515_00001976 [Chloebia gouldiae]